MPLIRTVPPSDWNCTTEVHFRSTVTSFLIFLNNYIFIQKSDIFIKLQRTRFSSDIISCSFILHMTARFVRKDRNCTTWTKNIGYRVRYVLATSMVCPQVANWGDVLPKCTYIVATNTSISIRGQPVRSGPPSWGLDVRLTTPRRKKQHVTNCCYTGSRSLRFSLKTWVMENGHRIWNLECDEPLYATVTENSCKIIGKISFRLSESTGRHVGQGRHWNSEGL